MLRVILSLTAFGLEYSPRVLSLVVRFGFIAMGRPRGSNDKVPRKRRGGDRSVVSTTGILPMFASSNNRRGNVTRQQRLFAAHFQDESSVGHSGVDSIGLNVGNSEG